MDVTSIIPPSATSNSLDGIGSVSVWIDELKGGDPDAARRLWARYFRQMMRYSRTRLRASDRLAADEEDVALSAFQSFCHRAGAGRFPELLDRDGLWNLLVCIMARKASAQIARERTLKRGGMSGREGWETLEQAAAPAPPPDLAAQMADEFQGLLDRLPDDSLRTVAVLRLDGFTGDEIAAKLGCGVRTVERKLVVIRQVWGGGEP